MKTGRNNSHRPAEQKIPEQSADPVLSTADILLQKAMGHHQAGQIPLAEAIYRRILQLSPDHPDALQLLGLLTIQAGKYAVGLELIDKSIQLNPRNAYAHSNRSLALNELHRYQEALESCDKAIGLIPDYADAYSNRGNALYGLHRYQEALESCDTAIHLKPNFADAHNNRGNALYSLCQYQAALESYNKAIRLKPDFADACNNLGNVLYRLDRFQAALECFDKAILLRPDFADAYNNRGNTLYRLDQYQAALESFDKAILLKPDLKYLHGMQLHMKQFLCQWEDIESQGQHIQAQIDRNEKVATPFVTIIMSNSPSLQKKAAEIFVHDKYISNFTAIPRRPRQDRIRIGYFSADFHNHATSYLMAELFERHDRSKFEILGFSFGPDAKDEMRERVSTAMDRFLDVRFMSDREVAQRSRELGVDIAIDLKGFTKGCRAGIFAERAAPIQVNYLGYPGTMGASYMDYLIADRTLIPESSQQHYSEKIVYLPDSYQVNDSQRLISDKIFSRSEEGLPEQGFVYCSFNNNYKITPGTFDLWMRILRQVEGSVLWLLESNPWASENLRKEAERRGVSPARLIFAKRLPLAEHLGRHSLADLFLDTYPCNAHTTASDALWAGLPVLTYMGETFASRVAASLLRAVDLPELVTTREADYETLAVAIATIPGRSQKLKETLRRNRLTTPLFDLPAFTRHIEAAYSAMYAQYQKGLPPNHICIEKQRS